MSLHLRLAGAAAAGCVFVAALGFVFRRLLTLSAAYVWIAVLVFAAMSLAALALREDHPFPHIGAANWVTVVRAALVALLAALIGEAAVAGVAATALVLVIAVSVLDGVDGWLARRTGLASAFGGRIDMETDALLIMVVSVLVWRHGKAGAWVLAGGLMRYAFVAAGWLLPWMARPLTPTRRARTITVCHFVGLSVAIAPIVKWPLSAIAVGVTVAALAWSFALDIRRLWRARGRESLRSA
jgi:phosphatidylglycerophosphate synthase